MKIKVFEQKKWREVNGYDFNDFINAVVYPELPFKFTDCTDEEIEEFVKYLYDESGCLDDGEYQNWYCDADMADMVYVFENMHCKLLLEALRDAERKVDEYSDCIANWSEDEDEEG